MAQSVTSAPDKYADLTPQFGEKAIAWAKVQTDATRARLEASPTFKAVMDDMARVHAEQRPLPTYHLLDGHLYFRIEHDSAHPYGRIAVAEARADGRSGDDWRTVFDLDVYNKSQPHPYTFKWLSPRAECLAPTFDRCMISLYYDGGQNNAYVELDMRSGRILEDGFRIAPGRNSLSWLDKDTLLVAHTTEGAKAMPSQFPAQLYVWKRGTPLAKARKVYEISPQDSLFGFDLTEVPGSQHIVVSLAKSYTSFQLQELKLDGSVADLPLPKALNDFGTPVFSGGKLAVQLAAPHAINGKTYPADTIVAYDFATRHLSVVMTPPKGVYLSGGFSGTKSGFAIVGIRNLQRILYLAKPAENGWTVQQRLAEPAGTTLQVASTESSDGLLLKEQGLTTPPQVRYLAAGAPVLVDRASAAADLGGYVVDIQTARSADGESIDYYLMHKRGAVAGPTPTILQGYGGFGVSNDPSYFCCHLGAGWKTWFDRGGALAIAATRGGGERGSAWHLAGAGIHKIRSFDDFDAVAEALERSGFTDAAHLAITGHSEGGQLVAVAAVRRPDLYAAALIGAPVTDNAIVGHGDGGISAGMAAEEGDWNNPMQRRLMRLWDPYSNIRAGVRYPTTLSVVATTDNQVGPSHARRFVAKMLEVGAPAMLLEGTAGGHDYPDEYTQTADMAMQMSFLIDALMQ